MNPWYIMAGAVPAEEMFLADRDAYPDMPESLECFDEACGEGISAMFYTWPPDEE